ncbi:MAG: L,D-transpeptidase [Clostridiaceae bacterium]
MDSFVSSNNIQSPTNYLLITDLRNRLTYVYRKNNNSWQQLYRWSCTVGKPETPTVQGIFDIKGRKPGFGTDRYSVKYATRIIGGYYYHSILYNSTGSYVIDGRLGMALSHGCIRLATQNAKWIYDNIPNGTTVLIH